MSKKRDRASNQISKNKLYNTNDADNDKICIPSAQGFVENQSDSGAETYDDDLLTIMPNTLFYAQTIQTHALRNIFEVLNHVQCKYANLKAMTDGIRMYEMDQAKNILICLSLKKFEAYKCVQTMYIGLETDILCGILRNCTNNILTLYILEDDPVHIHLNVHNTETHVRIHEVVRLLILPELECVLPEKLQMTHALCMPNLELQRHIQILSRRNSKHAYVTYLPPTDSTLASLRLFTKSDLCVTEVIIEPNTSTMQWEKIVHDYTQKTFTIVFPIKYIERICKNQISKHVTLFLSEKKPIVMMYAVADLGTIHFIICNCTEEKECNISHPGQMNHSQEETAVS
jgi:proliferating cell nuclear antigen PCNA